MAKTKTPYFSMGAQGSVGGAITAQKRGQATILRSKPLPTDPYSLFQAYQRWRYQDYAYLWTQQTNATRAEYRRDGLRHHLTAFQYWMRYQLKNMPDIAGIWHLDARDHTTAHDSGPNGNDGAVIGATPATGLIDGCLYFDGLNDLVVIPHSASLTAGPTIRLSCFIYPTAAPLSTRGIIDKRITATTTGYVLLLYGSGDIRFGIYDGTNPGYTALVPIPMAAWSYIDAYYDGATAFLYVDGVLKSSVALNLTLKDSAQSLILAGNTLALPRYFDGYLDQLVISTRAPTTVELNRWNERTYPPQ